MPFLTLRRRARNIDDSANIDLKVPGCSATETRRVCYNRKKFLRGDPTSESYCSGRGKKHWKEKIYRPGYVMQCFAYATAFSAGDFSLASLLRLPMLRTRPHPQHVLSCYTYDMSTTQFQAPFQRLMDAIAGAVPLGLEQIATSLTTKKPATGWARLPLMALARVGRRAQVIRIPRNPHTQSAQSATLSTQPAEVVLRVYNLAPCLARYRAFTIFGCLSLVLGVLTFLSMCNVFSYCMCTRTHVRA